MPGGTVGLAAYERNIGAGSIGPAALNSKNRKYTLCNFQNQGAFVPAAGTGTAAGATGSTNYGSYAADIGGVLPIAYHIKGAGQTIVAPTFAATGADWALDQADDEGVEIIFGGNTTRGKHAYTIGTNPVGARGFFAQLTVAIGDADGTDEFLFGFRIDQAANAAHTAYTDYAAIGIFTAASPALLQTKTRLNTGTASLVSTTQTKADGVAMTLCVCVDQDGRVKFLIDGANPTVVGANGSFQFDAGDVVYPFLFSLNAAALMDTVRITNFESGYYNSRGA